jgi:hypothetical protein
MASATRGGYNNDLNPARTRNLAQNFALIVGLVLVLVGLLGFIADATFDTGATADPEGGNVGGALQGDSFLGFEVNGWHNIVHILSGLLLLSGVKRPNAAKTVLMIFGVTYLLVTIIGLIDGNDILGILPINPADNVLHALLAIGALAIGLSAKTDEGERREHNDRGTGAGTTGTGGTSGARVAR